MSGKTYIINKIHEFLENEGFEAERIHGPTYALEHQLKIKNKILKHKKR